MNALETPLRADTRLLKPFTLLLCAAFLAAGCPKSDGENTADTDSSGSPDKTQVESSGARKTAEAVLAAFCRSMEPGGKLGKELLATGCVDPFLVNGAKENDEMAEKNGYSPVFPGSTGSILRELPAADANTKLFDVEIHDENGFRVQEARFLLEIKNIGGKWILTNLAFFLDGAIPHQWFISTPENSVETFFDAYRRGHLSRRWNVVTERCRELADGEWLKDSEWKIGKWVEHDWGGTFESGDWETPHPDIPWKSIRIAGVEAKGDTRRFTKGSLTDDSGHKLSSTATVSVDFLDENEKVLFSRTFLLKDDTGEWRIVGEQSNAGNGKTAEKPSTEARIAATKTTLSGLETAAQVFRLQTGRWPGSAEDMQRSVGGGEPVLDPSRTVLDGWGAPFRFRVSNGTLEIASPGPDGLFDTEDDITNKDR